MEVRTTSVAISRTQSASPIRADRFIEVFSWEIEALKASQWGLG
jgi:hypothetical protein